MPADNAGGTVAYNDHLFFIQTVAHFLHERIDIGVFVFPVVKMLRKDNRIFLLPHAAGLRPCSVLQPGAAGKHRLSGSVLFIQNQLQLFQQILHIRMDRHVDVNGWLLQLFRINVVDNGIGSSRPCTVIISHLADA